uniref:Secreted protein n=1 Tax=Meleagris gallopavo TaxID=9103 RepID=A0A803Y6C2_MELGA
MAMGPWVASPSALRVALAGVWQVVRGRRLRHFPRVLALWLPPSYQAARPPYCLHGCHFVPVSSTPMGGHLVPMAAIFSHWPPFCHTLSSPWP